MRRQNELDLVLFTGGAQQVQRGQVIVHVAVGRVDHRGAAVEDVVAAEQQSVFEQHQADMVGRVAGRVQHQQGVRDAFLAELQALAVGQGAVRHELAVGACGRR